MKMMSPLSQFDVICIIPFWIGNNEISLTNLSLTVFFVLVIGAVFFRLLYTNYLIPRNWQIFLESIFIFVYRLVYQQLGKEGIMYFPFVFSLFTFILMLNLFSMLPYSFAVTSHFIWTLYFSLSICLGIFFLGILKHKIHFFKLFVLDVPLFLAPIMIILEILSYIIRTFSLSIRLSANILAGHTLVHIIADFVVVMSNLKFLLVFLPFLLLLAIFVLELGVACLQAYIFVTLMCMYLNDSIHLADH
jgi:ATP synthase subunit 6